MEERRSGAAVRGGFTYTTRVKPVANDAEDLMIVFFEWHEVPVSVDAGIAEAQHFRVAAHLFQECHIGDGRAASAEFAGDPGYRDVLEVFPFVHRLGLQLVGRGDGPRGIGRRCPVHQNKLGGICHGRIVGDGRRGQAPAKLCGEGIAVDFDGDDGLDEIGTAVGDAPAEESTESVIEENRGAQAIDQLDAAEPRKIGVEALRR